MTPRPKQIQRNIEASVGGQLLKMVNTIGMKKSKMIGPKKVFLPKLGIHMHYYEREAVPTMAKTDKDDSAFVGTGSTIATDSKSDQDQPTIIFCHGISETAKSSNFLISALDIPPHVRILCPDQIGHGEDLKRAISDPQSFKQPTHESMLESTSEFLDVVKAGNNCNAFGISMGGGLVYYLRFKRPDVIQRTVLVSPAIQYCLDDAFVDGLLKGKNNFIDFQSREDVKLLFRNALTIGPYDEEEENNNKDKYNNNSNSDSNQPRRKKDPVPKFLLESIYRAQNANAPEGHHRKMMRSLLKSAGITPTDDDTNDDNDDDDKSIFTTEIDIDQDSPRLVIWPEQDQICNYEKAKRFFKNSTETNYKGKRRTEFESIPHCGHVFHADGRSILDLIVPKTKQFLLDFS
jgi:pimeloyl-ACP methyl ester carboxylesterase